MGLTIGLLGTAYADEVSDATAFEMVGVQSYSPAGYFYQQDFEPLEDGSPFDWAFETPNGKCYQLQGNEPTEDNLFGWTPVDCADNPTKTWVMIQVGDTDGDGSPKFDWVMLSTDPDNPAVYKLNGVADNGSFEYSDKMVMDYEVTVDAKGNSVIVITGAELLEDNEATMSLSVQDTRYYSITLSCAGNDIDGDHTFELYRDGNRIKEFGDEMDDYSHLYVDSGLSASRTYVYELRFMALNVVSGEYEEQVVFLVTIVPDGNAYYNSNYMYI